VGYLDEATGSLMVVENGQGLTPARQSEGAAQVAGYVSGPTRTEESQLPPPGATGIPFTGLPPLDLARVSLPSLTVALQASTIPLPLASTLPDVTVSLPQATQLPEISVPLPSTAPLPALTVSLPSLETPPLNIGSIAGLAPLSVNLPPIVSLEPGAQAQPPPPPAPRGKKAKPPPGKKAPPSPAVHGQTPLSPELVSALEKVRAFMVSQVERGERRRATVALADAARANRPTEELVKLALQPVLATGEARYRVLDELLVIKDELGRHPPGRVIELLLPMFR
jgi:hypothetical protein